ncbi:hypothetical protein KAR91_26960 [Candidatus Pacearchaeota archaeon]|nr:hypothetical protein [Candidatus Pacearchaeota archaeon]
MATLRQLRDRKRELEAMRYRKKTRTRVPTSDTKESTKKAVEWVAERLTVINKQIAEREKK